MREFSFSIIIIIKLKAAFIFQMKYCLIKKFLLSQTWAQQIFLLFFFLFFKKVQMWKISESNKNSCCKVSLHVYKTNH